MTKSLNKLGIKGIFLNLVKFGYEKSTANIILKGKRLSTFQLWLAAYKGCLLLHVDMGRGKRRVGQIGRLRLMYIHYYV